VSASARSLVVVADPPRAAAGSAPHPALILLHGRGADEHDLRPLIPSFDPSLAVFSVRAPFPFAGGGYAWYDVEEAGVPDRAQFGDSLARLVRFVDGLPERGIDPRRVFLLGFSMGAVMANALGLTVPRRIAGVIAHSGYVPPEEPLALRADRTLLAGKAWFVAHGTLDAVLPVHFGRDARERLEALGVDLTYREYEIGHWIGEDSLRDLAGWLAQKLEAGRRIG
jgi:phospholipase/carboxylesterase